MKDFIVAMYWVKGNISSGCYNERLAVAKIISDTKENAINKALITDECQSNVKEGFYLKMYHVREG